MSDVPTEQASKVTTTLVELGLWFSFEHDAQGQPVWKLAPFKGDPPVEIRISLSASNVSAYHWVPLQKQPQRELLAKLLGVNYFSGFAKVGILENPAQNWVGVSAQLAIRHLDKTALGEIIGAVFSVSKEVHQLVETPGLLNS